MADEFYPKIPAPFWRHIEGPNKNKFNYAAWISSEVAMLADLNWRWTEKVDGTNIRVIWDGYKVTFGGRTDGAQISAKLVTRLREMFGEELLEQVFKATPATLFGEGYGAGIQSGGKYDGDQRFILFDVKIDKWWLKPENVKEIADALGIERVPYVMLGSITEAIRTISRGAYSKWAGGQKFHCEGYVGSIDNGLLTRAGERIQVKVKTKDFLGVDIDKELADAYR